MSRIADNLTLVRKRIAEAAKRAGRDPGEIKLVAVSKTQPESAIEEAYAAGQRDFGENYAQELARKAAALAHLDIRWHYIGRIQTNKAKYLARHAHVVHTVDSRAVAEELNRRAKAEDRILSVLAQVNIADEEQKNGAEPADVPDLVECLMEQSNLVITGFMILPPFWPAEQVRPFFRRLRVMSEELQKRYAAFLPALSMGMSADFEAAVEEGSTLVRVGTAIFGERS